MPSKRKGSVGGLAREEADYSVIVRHSGWLHDILESADMGVRTDRAVAALIAIVGMVLVGGALVSVISRWVR